MATYWKSQPKKHCDFCQCWIADNKASIDFHERGKRHKENVEKKLAELRKKGHEQYKMQQTLESDLLKMETEALKAFKKDLANDPALAAQYKAQATAAAASAAAAAKKKEELLTAARRLHKEGLAATKQAGKTTSRGSASSAPSSAPASDTSSHTVETAVADVGYHTDGTPQCVWLEGTSPEGHTYYWNTVTGESQWEKPEGYEPTEESTMYKQQVHEDRTGETAEQEQPEPASESTKASQEVIPPGTEDEEPEKNDGGDEKEDNGSGEEEESDDEEDDEKEEEAPRPAKRKMVNPYGGWTTVVREDTPPVDLQLPQPERPYFQPIVPQAAQHQPSEKIQFKERTVSSLASSSSWSSRNGATSFKKRKFAGGGRSIRQRDTDT
ncbi:WW domain-binding protein 4-like [Acanthaster planci]|uniref:WW domain-binding protein 4-like n=1 Tax=Acanthaster planci TaxID=133434 RepID=A0A8B7XWV4_ACAPL|nr:WW domain-binding protein 4-like [Acanthaster planci]